jgi:crotonobetainyl-CoA:carnitine CoA-transferase CaiB-like acyl-CoA transferase
MSGIMDLTGEPSGSPQKLGVAFADIFTGMYGVVAIQAALARRNRDGVGEYIDMALLDVMVAVLANQALNYFVSGKVPARLGNSHPNIVPYQTFAVSDGVVMIAVGNDAQFQRLCATLGVASLADEPRFAANKDRVEHREELAAILTERLASCQREDLLAQLEAVGVPAGPVNTLEDVFSDPQVLHRQMRLDLEAAHVAEGLIPSLRNPIRFLRAPLTPTRAAPALGEHTDEVRRELEVSRAGGPRQKR